MAFSLIYVTHADKDAATTLISLLLKEKLIACGNAFPITSAYWWDGEIHNEEEWVSLLKTTDEKWSTAEQRITEVHPYEVPCIMRMSVESNGPYEKWIRQEVE